MIHKQNLSTLYFGVRNCNLVPLSISGAVKIPNFWAVGCAVKVVILCLHSYGIGNSVGTNVFICRRNAFWTKWQTKKKQSRKRWKQLLSGLLIAAVISYRNSEK